MNNQPQCRVDADGTKEWCLHGELHREGGPAVEHASGRKYWCLHGELHREDGPAVEYPDGTKWWRLNGKEVHPETLVDLQLSRGVFCYYDEQANTLHFAENK